MISSAKLYRVESSHYATFGVLVVNGEVLCTTLELPWLDNTRNVSCIPEGTYQCHPVRSPKFGEVYEVKDVPGRSNILFHPGNLPRDTEGCIIPGLGYGVIGGLRGVTQSRRAFDTLMVFADEKPFPLEVINVAEPKGGEA